jgi:2-oxoglutarate ferredoxin oxidoreductase subunit alpha
MSEKVLITGNEAIARGAVAAGCKFFFGYPITPQSDIGEYLSGELPKIGGAFIQSESEIASIYMLYGGALSGERVMTSTSGCGFALMGEGISYISTAEVPCVLVDVMRMGPGIGTGGQHGQTDYRLATTGGGHGGYRCVVLAASSPQECFDLVQLAFHLAEKYEILVMVLSDFIIGRMAEPVEIRTIDFGPVPEKDWALVGKGKKGGKFAQYLGSTLIGRGFIGGPGYHLHQRDKYQKIVANEVRYETYQAEDAEILLASYGSSARICRGAVEMGRAEGLKLGLFRPITVWPFPHSELREAALRAGKVLVVEDSIGEFVDDVEFAVLGRVPIHLLGVWGRHLGMGSGVIHPERVLEEVKSTL